MLVLVKAIAPLTPQGLGKVIAGLLGWQFEPALAQQPLDLAVEKIVNGVFPPAPAAPDGSPQAWNPYLLKMADGIVMILGKIGMTEGAGLQALEAARFELANP